jgi:Concanavalin A-like lectin/glucanases superfamily/Secretion system C-terminal sorting domain
MKKITPILLLVLLTFFVIQQNNAQTVIANYPLVSNLSDITTNYGDMTLNGTAVMPAGALCADGVYPNGATTPNMGTLNPTHFEINVDFALAALPTSSLGNPIIVAGNGWRWLGVHVDNNGLLKLLYNNSAWLNTSATVSIATAYNLKIQYDNGHVLVLLDGTLILDDCIGALNTGSNYNFTTTNYSVSRALNGCINTLIITNNPVMPIMQTDNYQTICQGQTITVGTSTYSTSGTYADVVTHANGCPNQINTYLTVNPTYDDTISKNICMGDTYILGTQTLTSSGTYTELFSSSLACDSLITIHLNIDSVDDQSVTALLSPICQGDTTDIVIGDSEIGVFYTLRDETNDTIVSGPTEGNGIAMNFSTGAVNTNMSYNVLAEYGGNALDFNGINNYLTIPHNAAFNCTNLTLEAWIKVSPTNPDYSAIISKSVFNNAQFTFQTFENSNRNLRIYCYNSQYIFEVTTANNVYEFDTWTHIAAVFDDVNNYIKIYVDGIEVASSPATLSMYNNTKDFNIGQVNNSYYYRGQIDDVRIWDDARTAGEISGNRFIELSGNEPGLIAYYMFNDGIGSTIAKDETSNNLDLSLTNMNPATVWVDSRINSCFEEMAQLATVTVNPVYNIADSIAICDGDTLSFASQLLTTAGTYYNTFSSISGCDSTITLELTINPTYITADTVTICNKDSYMLGTQTLTTAGNYSEVYTTALGCDSTINLALNVRFVDTSITQNSAVVLTANAAAATYQWVDCNNAYAPLAGETGQIYTSLVNGSFAVIVTENGCTDTSSCYAITSASIETLSSSVNIYPNPTSKNVYVDFGDSYQNIIVTLTNSIGQIMHKEVLHNVDKYELSLEHLANGIYFMQINLKEEKLSYKIIKQ